VAEEAATAVEEREGGAGDANTPERAESRSGDPSPDERVNEFIVLSHKAKSNEIYHSRARSAC